MNANNFAIAVLIVWVIALTNDFFKDQPILKFGFISFLYFLTLGCLISNLERARRLHLVVKVGAGLIAVFFTFIAWAYFLDILPMNIFSAEIGSKAAFVSLLVPSMLATFLVFLVLVLPTAILFGKKNCLITFFAMLLVMFVHGTAFDVSNLTSRIILIENLFLGLICSLALFLSANNIISLLSKATPNKLKNEYASNTGTDAQKDARPF